MMEEISEKKEGSGANQESNYNYGKVVVSKLPVSEFASNIIEKDFYFKRGYNAFRIFLKLLGNFYLGSTIRYDFLTGKKQNFAWIPATIRLLFFVSLCCFIAHFFCSYPFVMFFTGVWFMTPLVNVLFLLYFAVITVKAAQMIRENGVQIGCRPGCEYSKEHHLSCFENNESSDKKCDQGHDETLPMILSVNDVTSCQEDKS